MAMTSQPYLRFYARLSEQSKIRWYNTTYFILVLRHQFLTDNTILGGHVCVFTGYRCRTPDTFLEHITEYRDGVVLIPKAKPDTISEIPGQWSPYVSASHLAAWPERSPEQEFVSTVNNLQFTAYDLRLMSYLWLLYLMSVIFSFILGSTPSIIIYGEKSPLKDDIGWFLLITTIVAVSLTVLASVILVFASCYMKSYMRTSHYTVFKTIGSSSGILAHFSLGCFLIFPHIKLNWIAYSVICVIIVKIAVGYWFL
ncbi:hypothetical protein Tco_0469166 [Tanacetum coccineum]